MKLNKILITTMLGITLGLTGCASEKAETPETPTTEVEKPVTDNTVDLGNGQKAINLSEEETLQYKAGDVIVVEGDTIELPDQLTLENNGLVYVYEEYYTEKNETGEILYDGNRITIFENDAQTNIKQPINYNGTLYNNVIKKIYIVEYDAVEYIDNEETIQGKGINVISSDGEPISLAVPFLNPANQKTK